jgi:hypothetical protein
MTVSNRAGFVVAGVLADPPAGASGKLLIQSSINHLFVKNIHDDIVGSGCAGIGIRNPGCSGHGNGRPKGNTMVPTKQHA